VSKVIRADQRALGKPAALRLFPPLAGAGLGCTGVVVDAKPEAVSFYEQFGFAPLEVVEGQSQARPAATAMFLPLREIAAAIK
jgi:hypothetical protein